MIKQRPMKTKNRNIHNETKEDYISRPNIINIISIFEYLLSILIDYKIVNIQNPNGHPI